MSEDKFNLQWKAYETHVRTAFVDMYNNNNFSDVTLVSDDQKTISSTQSNAECLQSSPEKYSAQ